MLVLSMTRRDGMRIAVLGGMAVLGVAATAAAATASYLTATDDDAWGVRLFKKLGIDAAVDGWVQKIRESDPFDDGADAPA